MTASSTGAHAASADNPLRRMRAGPAIDALRATLYIERSTLAGGTHGTSLFPGLGAPAPNVAESTVRVGERLLRSGGSDDTLNAAILDAGPLRVGLRDGQSIAGTPPTFGPIR